mmetsp:Transcript_103051/g.181596  ORF Transcript_103051/g.181596 Transcript_103051/m.181596 type:complete len:162 (-) Transcript_103051:38-523(-)
MQGPLTMLKNDWKKQRMRHASMRMILSRSAGECPLRSTPSPEITGPIPNRLRNGFLPTESESWPATAPNTSSAALPRLWALASCARALAGSPDFPAHSMRSTGLDCSSMLPASEMLIMLGCIVSMNLRPLEFESILTVGTSTQIRASLDVLTLLYQGLPSQ